MAAAEDVEGVPGRAAGRGERAERVFVREYAAGRLIREDPISPEELEAVFGPFRRRADRAERRQRRRRRVWPKLNIPRVPLTAPYRATSSQICMLRQAVQMQSMFMYVFGSQIHVVVAITFEILNTWSACRPQKGTVDDIRWHGVCRLPTSWGRPYTRATAAMI